MLLPSEMTDSRTEAVVKKSEISASRAGRSYRYERKFLIENHSPRSVEGAVHLHPAQFHRIYPPRFVNNIYLDTPLLRNYREAVDGIASRLKARIRWYGELFATHIYPCLELKGKEGNVCHKSVFQLKGFTFSKGLGTRDISALLTESELPAAVSSYIGLMKPALVNRYRRKYWRSRDGQYRLTLDRNLWYGGFNVFDNEYLNQTTAFTNTIIEVKYDPEADERFSDISNRFGFRQSRSSKFVSGIEHVYRLGNSR